MKRLFLALVILVTTQVQASEPYFCNPDTFLQLEKKTKSTGVNRLRVFQIRRLTLAGMAVGYSEDDFVDNIAHQLAQVPRSEKSCTWYVNKGNSYAEQLFNHAYAPNPMPCALRYILPFWPAPHHFRKNDYLRQFQLPLRLPF